MYVWFILSEKKNCNLFVSCMHNTWVNCQLNEKGEHNVIDKWEGILCFLKKQNEKKNIYNIYTLAYYCLYKSF